MKSKLGPSKVASSKQGNVSQAGYAVPATTCSVSSDGDQWPMQTLHQPSIEPWRG